MLSGLLPRLSTPKVPPSHHSLTVGPKSWLAFPASERANELLRSLVFLRRPQPILLSPYFVSRSLFAPENDLACPFCVRFEDFFVSAPLPSLSKAPPLAPRPAPRIEEEEGDIRPFDKWSLLLLASPVSYLWLRYQLGKAVWKAQAAGRGITQPLLTMSWP